MPAKITPTSQYEITVRLACPHKPGWIAKITAAIGENGGAIRAIDLVHVQSGKSLRDYTIECSSTNHARKLVEVLHTIDQVEVLSVSDDTFLMHLGGKLEIHSKVQLLTRADLSTAKQDEKARSKPSRV